MTITLYPDQAAFIDQVRDGLKVHRRLIAQAFCGFGKTVIAAEITHKAFLKGKRVVFAVHRKQIRKQTALTFLREGIPYGIVGRDKPCQVMVGTMQAIRKRLAVLPADLLFIDEGHIYASGFADVHAHYNAAGAFIVCLTATPTRFNGRGMRDYYDTIVEGPTAQWLIENRRLSDYKLYAPQLVELTGMKVRNGDYAAGDAEALVDKPKITGDAIMHWRNHAAGLRTLVFCSTVQHSRDVAQQFNEAGIPAAHMDAGTSDIGIQTIIGQFAEGTVQVLCNCMLATEGFDLSAQVGRDVPIECVVMLRPTKSLSLFIQMSGRALRMKDRPAVILDHVGNTNEHGLPDGLLEWSLDGRKKREARKVWTCKKCYGWTCKKCYGVFATYQPVCPSCGSVPEVTLGDGRAPPEQVDGQLAEVDKDAVRQRKRVSFDPARRQARSLEDLQRYAREKGFKDSWVTHVWNARQQKLRRA